VNRNEDEVNRKEQKRNREKQKLNRNEQKLNRKEVETKAISITKGMLLAGETDYIKIAEISGLYGWLKGRTITVKQWCPKVA